MKLLPNGVVVTTLYVEKDLAAVCKAVWDHWESRKGQLNHKHLLAAGARETPGDIARAIEKSMYYVIRWNISGDFQKS
jgi:hypothetical protein